MESKEWLEEALKQVCGRMENDLDLDADLISGLVSFCELAPPPDAADYLMNIIGLQLGQPIIKEYLQRRGFNDSSISKLDMQTTKLLAYVKPPADEGLNVSNKKQNRLSKDSSRIHKESLGPKNTPGDSNAPQKKKSGKVISIAEASKGSVVFQQGRPCSCQARRHRLVNNCLSCGKIVCEQEGEGPCCICGALVLREGSTYAGLDEFIVPTSDAEATAEAYAKRLVEYDRNSAARTKVIDDQSDYYEMDGNSWLSSEEKELLQKKQTDIKEAEEARRRNVIVTFDLVGRKVILSKDEATEMESEYRILRPPAVDREQNRVRPNPAIKTMPIFVNDTAPPSTRKPDRRIHAISPSNGLCLEVSGRVQHDRDDILRLADSHLKHHTAFHEDEPDCD